MKTSTPAYYPVAYYPVLVALIGTLAACAPVDGTPVGTRDVGSPVDAGTDSDEVGEDTDRTDDDTDSVDADVCTAEDLLWEAYVVDADGWEVDQIAPGASLTLVGVVENPCDHDVELDVESTCLIQGFEVVDRMTGDGDYQERACPLSGSNVLLRPGDVEEARHTWAGLAEGQYDLAVHFAIHGLSASTTVVIEQD